MKTENSKIILIIGLIVAAMSIAGSGDYADALATENARLRGALTVCHAAQEVQP